MPSGIYKHKRYGQIKKCIVCNKEFYVKQSHVKQNYCSRKCATESKIRNDKISKSMKLNNPLFDKKTVKKVFKTREKNGVNYTSHSEKFKAMLSKLRMGKNNPNYKHGKSKERVRIQGSRKYKKWRKSVFERDNYICQICGQRGGYLEVHHIKSYAENPKLRFDINNGVTLCKNCHISIDEQRKRFVKQYNLDFSKLLNKPAHLNFV